MTKNYLLDTNILLQNSENLLGFDDNNIYICKTTLEELDAKKKTLGETGFNAREIGRILDTLRVMNNKNTSSFLKLPNGGTLYIVDDYTDNLLPINFSLQNPDNRIINTGVYLNKTTKNGITLLTNDTYMRIKAALCNLNCSEVKNDNIAKIYTGHTKLDCSSDTINKLYKDKIIDISNDVKSILKDKKERLLENQFVTLQSGQQSALSIYRHQCLNLIRPQKLSYGISALNAFQTYAIYALLAPVEEIPLVILNGPAGTAKTFLSLAAGLSQVRMEQADEGVYNKIYISRPNAGSSDPGFGYLPGDLDEKMAPLLANYYDNLESIFKNNNNNEDNANIRMQIEDLFESETIEICPLNFIRGRSINNNYIICDEAQNATKNLIRDVITRAGIGTKVVIIGDERQCDAPGLDSKNNGLVYCIDKMKDSPFAAILRFSENNCVRSPLAEEAINKMQ